MVYLSRWNIFFIFAYIGNVIIPTVTHSMIFQRGRSTTNQIYSWNTAGFIPLGPCWLSPAPWNTVRRAMGSMGSWRCWKATGMWKLQTGHCKKSTLSIQKSSFSRSLDLFLFLFSTRPHAHFSTHTCTYIYNICVFMCTVWLWVDPVFKSPGRCSHRPL